MMQNPTTKNNQSTANSHLLWETSETEFIHDAGIFLLERVRRRSADERMASFYRLNTPDWVTVMAVLDTPEHAESFLVVRQYRHGSGEISLEFPAGNVNSGEKPIDAAARELMEETGYRAGTLRCIGAVSPNPAILTNTTHTFLATDLVPTGTQSLDENELLNVETMSFSALDSQIGHKPFNSAISVQAWYFYLRAVRGQNGNKS